MPRLRQLGDHVTDHLGCACGSLPQRRHIEIAKNSHSDSAWDRSSGHHEQVWALPRYSIQQQRPLLDAKAMLLIDHDQSQVGVLHLILQQRVGTDHDPGFPTGDFQ